jgi:hypothetical protein
MDEVDIKARAILEYLETSVYPYLMHYSEERANFGDRGPNIHRNHQHVEMRDHKKSEMIKGFHQDKDTYLGSIVKLIWAKNPRMVHAHNMIRECWKELDNNGGRCNCGNHAFLRGNRFSHNQKFIEGWE